MKTPKTLRIAITGANGFVGKNVRLFLSKNNVFFSGIARKNFQNFKSELKIVTLDLDRKDIISTLKNYDALIHLIGIGRQTSDVTFEEVNVHLTKKVLDLCKKANIKKIIYISGLGVTKQTTSAYFISKYRAEKEIIKSGINYTILRASYIVGSDDPLTKNLKRQIKNGKITVPGSGKYYLQPIYVEDVARVILFAIESEKLINKIIDLVGPQKITFNEYITTFTNKKNVKIENIDLEKAYHNALLNSNYMYGIEDLNIMMGNFLGDYKKLKKLCNFEFRKFADVLKTSGFT